MNKYTKISLNIIVVFAIAMAMSYVADSMHVFFGDWYCDGNPNALHPYRCSSNEYLHAAGYHWGWRHYLWMAMCLCLFVIQAFRISEIINSKD